MTSHKPLQGSLIDWSHPQAAGLKLCHLLNDGSGTPVDIASGQPVVLFGTPTWSPTAGGLGRSYATTTTFDSVPFSSQVLGVTYPYWVACGFVNTSTSIQFLMTQASSTSINPQVSLQINNGGGAGRVQGFLRDNSGATATLVGLGTLCNDGNPHLLAVVGWAPGSISLYFDGVLVASSSVTLGAMTCDIYTLGSHRANSLTTGGSQLSSGSLLWHQAGNGAVPDMAWLAREPYASVQTPGSIMFMGSSVSPTFEPWFTQSSLVLGMY